MRRAAGPEPQPATCATVGVISDTHGLLRPEALEALRGCDRIVHAGDIGRQDIIASLAALAPLTIVRGNVDTQDWCRAIPETASLEIAGVRLFVLHDIAGLSGDPAASGHAAVISGHSHKPRIERRGAVLFLNPGSAGPRRFSLPVSLARLHVGRGGLAAELVTLAP